MATEQDKRRTGERDRRVGEDQPSAAQGIKIASSEAIAIGDTDDGLTQTNVRSQSSYHLGAHDPVGEEMRRSRDEAIAQQRREV